MSVLHSITNTLAKRKGRRHVPAALSPDVWRAVLWALPFVGACQQAALATASQPAFDAPAPAALPAPSFSPQVQNLLAQMTLEENIEQMTQLNISVTHTTGVQKNAVLDSAKATALVRDSHVGSFLNLFNQS